VLMERHTKINLNINNEVSPEIGRVTPVMIHLRHVNYKSRPDLWEIEEKPNTGVMTCPRKPRL
jgi:hypothetical protein